jgi:hypothetical protein
MCVSIFDGIQFLLKPGHEKTEVGRPAGLDPWMIHDLLLISALLLVCAGDGGQFGDLLPGLWPGH